MESTASKRVKILAGVKLRTCPCVKSLQLCATLCDPMDCSPPGSSLSMGFSRQEYWSGLSCPPLGDLPGDNLLNIFL